MKANNSQFKFIKQIETRFADPVTAIDLSLKHAAFGSAMGRIAFYDLKADLDYVISDTQPELVRGITHSADGESIYISIGDISCQRYSAENLIQTDFWQVIDDPDDKAHKENCQRAFTFNYESYNCVMTI